ncbi:60 kDa SS-A/Ro ribonucleoprotein [Labrenzia sp. EL_159]|nr:60 kDa SS-A/Ro ribonucleoprotein [Labrenzia sp. EL_162]MBG6198638.1 60 kDa SS-A/Ro ribonucleoprotein [Labrenzia sp. EL_159]
MANKSLFASQRGRTSGKAGARNLAGGKAYTYEDRHKLAQLAATGSIVDTFYQSADLELKAVLETAAAVADAFLAKTAVYARQKGKMKDLPALLLAVLASRDPVLLAKAFPFVVTDGRMLRNFVQILRSGQTGRKSLGTRPKALVRGWLNAATDYQLLQANIGNDPSLADVIKMVHPKPRDAERAALFAWLIGKPCDVEKLPAQVRDYVAFLENPNGREVPDVPFQMLTHLQLAREDWTMLAERGSWNMVRMNLNTFLRHGVFEGKRFEKAPAVRMVADILKDPKRIRKARAFPYQLLTGFQALSEDMPSEIREAMHEAMEISVANVPAFKGQVVVCPDVSGSMVSPVTGYRKGATTVTRCVDVAALVSAAVLRRNRGATVLPFEVSVRPVKLVARDTILTNAQKLTEQWGGGTNCAAPLAWLNEKRRAPDLVILVSDNQSWAGVQQGRGTGVMREWETLKRRNPDAKLVCIDIAPYGTSQTRSRPDILNIGGFSDAVFDQIAAFAKGTMNVDQWVGEIEAIDLT